MTLNQPQWAAVSPDGIELVYNWEDPIMHCRKRDVQKELKRMAELAGSGEMAGRTAEQWKACRVEKVVLVRQADLKKSATRSR